MTLHVLHVSHAVNTGLAHCVGNYVAHQIAHDVRVTVACPGGRLGTDTARYGANVVEWRATRSPGRSTFAEARALARIIERVKPDVVHLHCAKAGLVGRLILRGRVPTVFTPHAWSFFAVEGMMRRAVREWERFATRWTDAVVCVSQAEATTGRRNGVGGRFEVYPNEVESSDIDALADLNRADVRTQLGLSAGQPVAVLTARLARQKGQDVALDAWPRVRESVPTAELVLIGDGEDRAELQARRVEGVRFLGLADRQTALRWMFAADVVVCPSRWEGMSLVPLEAMALGRPLVVSDVDGMREVVPEDTGILVPSENPEEFADAVTTMLTDPSRAMDAGEAGRRHALEAANGPRSVDRLLALYRELVAARSERPRPVGTR